MPRGKNASTHQWPFQFWYVTTQITECIICFVLYSVVLSILCGKTFIFAFLRFLHYELCSDLLQPKFHKTHDQRTQCFDPLRSCSKEMVMAINIFKLIIVITIAIIFVIVERMRCWYKNLVHIRIRTHAHKHSRTHHTAAAHFICVEMAMAQFSDSVQPNSPFMQRKWHRTVSVYVFDCY